MESLWEIHEIKRILRRFAPDILHIHSIRNINERFFLSLIPPIPIVFHLHDYNIFCPRVHLLNYQLKRCYSLRKCVRCYLSKHRGIFKIPGFFFPGIEKYRRRKDIVEEWKNRVSVFISPSLRTKKIAELFGIENIKVIRNGMVPFKGKRGKDKVVGYVGAISPHRGLHTVNIPEDFRAIAYGVSVFPFYKPEGWEIFPPFPFSDRNRVYSQFNVFVFPSLWEEVWGLAIDEALNCGIPVVARKIGGIPEHLPEEAGILIENDREWEDAIIRASYMEVRDIRLRTIHEWMKEVEDLYISI